jgi:uncharacterized protein (DUF1800 family)
VDEPSPATLDTLVDLYQQHDTAIRPLVRYLLESAEFSASTSVFARYAWPVEFVVRAIKEVGWIAYTANQAIPFLTAMGQLLFEPPNVGGWKTGTNWFSTSRMLARMNFARSLCGHQRYPLVERYRAAGADPDALVAAILDTLSPAPLPAAVRDELVAYVLAGSGTPWNGSEGELHVKIPSLARLIVSLPEYQLV